LEQEANEVRTPLEFIDEPLLGYPIALPGPHQQWNAALAVAALHRAKIPLNVDSLQYGLRHVHWPGRFELLPAAAVAGASQPVVLDGAHNPHAAAVLAATWQQVFPAQPATLVFSAVAAKDIAGILAHLAPLAAEIVLCPVATPRAVPGDELAAALPPNAPPHRVFPSFQTAFTAALATNRPVLVAGSLFLVGEARAYLTGGEFQSSTQ
jgi:dihydrofolate synthase/folylpolyglutamate synthase